MLRLVIHFCLRKTLRVSETRKLIYGESVLVIPCALLERLRTYWTFRRVPNDWLRRACAGDLVLLRSWKLACYVECGR